MGTFTSDGSGVKPTVEDVLHFLSEMTKRGEYAAATAQNYRVAVRQILTVCGEDEPGDDPRWILANIDDLGRRWGIKNKGKGESVRSYVSRTRSLLGDYLTYLDDPANFKKARASRPSGGERKSKPKKSKAAPKKSEEAPSQREETPAEAPRTSESTRTFPLGEEREIAFVVPNNLKREEVFKFSLHLIAMCEDFTAEDMARFRLTD